MDKYFATLDMALLKIKSLDEIDSPKATKLFRHLLDIEHDAGPEAEYIIRLWKKERNICTLPDDGSDHEQNRQLLDG
tara:strand:+ start:172 stop:402 length:231 start_codon:yes stop_codon:yes gene_type:complete